MAGYYDIVLGLIPVALLGITAALTVVGVSLTTAVPISALFAVALMGHAMFVNAPGSTVEEASSPRPPINTE
ncbi:hypothetical protein [Natrononativus amylolyticus]|uniref:hypothetical protein n=1 Tax=Natrononativus amylolyticus TaxID=2963434 RepID=UPI0020CBB704|nr:hypothetical protein [Natrononativus amylolyticus]